MNSILKFAKNGIFFNILILSVIYDIPYIQELKLRNIQIEDYIYIYIYIYINLYIYIYIYLKQEFDKGMRELNKYKKKSY